MLDVFISHAHSSAPQVQQIAEGLRALGYAVWWDDEVPAHRPYAEVIEERLRAAKAVLVLWSNEAVKSQWVRAEADVARSAGNLVQISVDGTTPPLPFNQIQCTDMTGWHGDANAAGRRKVIDSIAELVGRDRPTPIAPAGRTHARRRIVTIATAMLAVLSVVAALAWWAYSRFALTDALPDQSIAVLRFDPTSEDAETRELANAVKQEVLTNLAAESRFGRRIRSVSSQDSDAHATALASRLGVSYLLNGSVRPLPQGHRVSVQLIRGRDGELAWSQTYDLGRSIGQPDDTAQLIANGASANLDLDWSLALGRTATTSEAAFEYFASARRLEATMRARGTDLVKFGAPIIADLDKAIDLDPDFAPAHLVRGIAHVNRVGSGGGIDEATAMRDASLSIQRYVELRPDAAQGYAAQALMQQIDRDYAAAEKSLRRAHELDPNLCFPYEQLAMLAMRRGREADASHNWQQAIELCPMVSLYHHHYGVMLYTEGNFDQADREFDTATRLAPKGVQRAAPTLYRILISLRRGNEAEAQARFEKAWLEFGQSTPEAFIVVLPRVGHEETLRKMMATWDEAQRPVPAWSRFMAFYGLREYDEALDWLGRALDENSFDAYLRVRLKAGFSEISQLPEYRKILAHVDELEVSH